MRTSGSEAFSPPAEPTPKRVVKARILLCMGLFFKKIGRLAKKVFACGAEGPRRRPREASFPHFCQRVSLFPRCSPAKRAVRHAEVISPGLPRPATSPQIVGMTHRRKEEDQERLAAALRANLARRKVQARQRQEGEPRQRQEEGEPRQRQEGEPRQRQGAQLRPTEGTPEPDRPGAGERSHDSAGFVGDKPSG